MAVDREKSPEAEAIWKKFDKLTQEASERVVREAFASTLTLLATGELEGVTTYYAQFMTDILNATILTGDYEKGISLVEEVFDDKLKGDGNA